MIGDVGQTVWYPQGSTLAVERLASPPVHCPQLQSAPKQRDGAPLPPALQSGGGSQGRAEALSQWQC